MPTDHSDHADWLHAMLDNPHLAGLIGELASAPADDDADPDDTDPWDGDDEEGE